MKFYVYGNSAIFVYFYSNKDTALFVFRQMMAKFVNFETTGRVIRLLYLNFDARNSFSYLYSSVMLYMTVPCDVWISVFWSSDPPPPHTLSSVPLLVLMREKWSVSQMNKTEKKKCHLNLKKCFFFLPFSINVNLLHKRKITIKQ